MRFRLPSRLKGSGVSPETIERLRGKIDREDLPRVPPGQFVTAGWPVLHYGEVPRFDPQTWDFKVWGLVEAPLRLDYAAFRALPTTELVTDIHCVTRWSKLDQT